MQIPSAADDSREEESIPEDSVDASKAASPAPPIAGPISKNGFAVLQSALHASQGKFTPRLRAAYLDWAQQTVLADLAAAKASVPADCLSEVSSNAALRDAMFGAIYPPDPSLLRNYARLRAELGPEFMRKYRSLVIGIAVAERANGGVSVARPTIPHPTKIALRKEKEAAARAAETAHLAGLVAEFMRENAISALDLYTNAEQREQLALALGGRGCTAQELKVVRDPVQLFEPLKLAMVRLGQRPAEREAFPSMAVWLRHLASVYEATPSSTPPLKKGGVMPWPLFPMDRAPWPLLMPLNRSLPIGEANYIWEKFQGQHGGQRYHTYGPYQHFDRVRPLELMPSTWHWNAWPDRIVHGGVCTTMAPGRLHLNRHNLIITITVLFEAHLR
jgi:hypothetical protein